MKLKILLTAVTFPSFFLAVSGQVSKNTWMAGGLVQYTADKFTSTGNYSNKQRSTVIDLSVGYAFRDNQVLGLIASYAPSRYINGSSSDDEQKQEISTKGLGTFYRAYKPLSPKLYLYGQATAMYTKRKMTADGSWLYNSESNTGSLSVAPGISYAVLKNVHLELAIPNLVQVSYSKQKTSLPGVSAVQEKEETKLKSSLSSGLLKELGLGFKIFF